MAAPVATGHGNSLRNLLRRTGARRSHFGCACVPTSAPAAAFIGVRVHVHGSTGRFAGQASGQRDDHRTPASRCQVARRRRASVHARAQTTPRDLNCAVDMEFDNSSTLTLIDNLGMRHWDGGGKCPFVDMAALVYALAGGAAFWRRCCHASCHGCPCRRRWCSSPSGSSGTQSQQMHRWETPSSGITPTALWPKAGRPE
jgi:hypothetical protein